MTDRIDRFEGEHEFLSNFFPHETEFEGKIYPTSEHAFQAAKTEDDAEREKIRQIKKPGGAKIAGKKVRLRDNWNFRRTFWMETVLRAKFSDPVLREKLRQTGSAELIEGNTWNDTFWGVCRGKGENRLGKILMKLRAEIIWNVPDGGIYFAPLPLGDLNDAVQVDSRDAGDWMEAILA